MKIKSICEAALKTSFFFTGFQWLGTGVLVINVTKCLYTIYIWYKEIGYRGLIDGH